jgi:hypothetical protein
MLRTKAELLATHSESDVDIAFDPGVATALTLDLESAG